MPKITKHAEFLEDLRKMVTKEGAVEKEAGKPTATGKPGADTHPVSVSDKTEHVNKNEQGKPETNPQEFKQEKGKDGPLHGKKAEETAEVTKEACTKGSGKDCGCAACKTETKVAEEAKVAEQAKEAAKTPQLPDTGPAPTAKEATNKTEQTAAKVAEAAPTENLELAKLGQQLLTAIKAAQVAEEEAKVKEAEAPKATGKPGADTKYVSVSSTTEHVNKNQEGHPEKNPQEVKQEKAHDKSDPTKKHSSVTEEELDKQASFELGRQFCRSFLMTKVSSQQEVYKEAGRRDFETLIAQAAAELENNQQQNNQAQQTKQASAVYDEAQAEKLAEEQGAQAFYSMMKQAQDEYQAEQLKTAVEQRFNALAAEKTAAEKKAQELEAKLLEKEAAMQKKAEEEKRAQEFHTWGNFIVDQVMTRLQSEANK